MECNAIGYIQTSFATPDDAPRQGSFDDAPGTIHVYEAYRDGLQDFEAGHDVVVVWFADRADRTELVSRKRGRGVFATRSPARPNPICLTECFVESVDQDAGVLEVTGVDMADGSPLLDLKPPVD